MYDPTAILGHEWVVILDGFQVFCQLFYPREGLVVSWAMYLSWNPCIKLVGDGIYAV